MTTNEKTKTWEPHPGPQTDFHQRAEFEVLYGGARGGGKTESLLMEALRFVEYPRYRAVFFRRTFPELQEIIDRSKLIYPQAVPGATWRGSEHRWVFPSGAVIRMAQLESEDDKYKYVGHEYQGVFWDELTHFHESQYIFLMGSCRSTTKDIPARIRASCNPGNIGHAWVKKRFIDPLEPGGTITDERTGLTRCFIPAKVYDNPTLIENDPMYVKRLEAIPDEKTRRMMLLGDWDVFAGQVFSEFDRQVHVIEPFEVPEAWVKFIAIDWGYSKPFAVLWIAQDFYDRLYVYREWYGIGSDEYGRPKEDVGLQLDAFQVAQGVRSRCVREPISYAVMDASMWGRVGFFAGSIADDFERVLGGMGIGVMQSHKGPGTRLNHKNQIHARLKQRGDGRPSLLFFNTCFHSIRTLPALVYDEKKPEEVDTSCEDHAYDALCYGVDSKPMTDIVVSGRNERASVFNLESFRAQRPDRDSKPLCERYH